MTEHLVLDARESTEDQSGRLDLLQPPDTDRSARTIRGIGDRALGLAGLPNAAAPNAYPGDSNGQIGTGGAESMTNNQEGIQNAELFKQKFDAAIEAIDDALQGGTNEIPAILSSIDTLQATPYISSAPEFVAMVQAARSSVEAAGSLAALYDEDIHSVFAALLSQARQQLAGTLIAYRSQ